MRVVALIALFTFAIWFLGAQDFAGGVDGGTHYAAALHLAQYLTWPFPSTSVLNWIPYYPPAAHLVAAATGAVVGSTLHGIFIAAAIFVATFYLAAAELMKGTTITKSVVTYVVFIFLAILLRKYRFTVGNEMIINFFFAQLGGAAALLVGYIVAYKAISLSFGRWLIVLTVAIHLVGWFFSLAAVQLAFAAAVMRGAPMFELRHDIKNRIVETVISGLVLGAAAIIHPTMLNMFVISANDGGITLSNHEMVALVVGSVLVISLFFYQFYRSCSVQAGALFSLGLGALSPCVVLGLFYIFGMGGSLYAVKKSGFLLGTVALMLLSVLVAEWIVNSDALKRRCRRLGIPEPSRNVAVLLPYVFALIVIPSIYQGRSSEAVANLDSYDRAVEQLIAQDRSNRLYGVTLLMNNAVTPHANFLVGFPRLQQTTAIAAQHQLFFTKRPKLDGVNFIVVGAEQAKGMRSHCVTLSSGRLAVITPDCFSELMEKS